MSVPTLNIIHILKENRDYIIDKLKSYSYGQVPYLIDITTLNDQSKVLAIIESFILENDIRQVPVPLMVLSDYKQYKGSLRVTDNMNAFPMFYRKKNKSLNVREAQLSANYAANCNKLANTDIETAIASLAEFSEQHSNLYHLASEGEFLENLLAKMKVNQ